jgi:ectoine hydroxylase-related dioxygenase (phytanoyl-CoA dioxygenase family)
MSTCALTGAMRQQWQEEGFLVLKNALTRQEAADYLAEADRVVEDYRQADVDRFSKGAFTITQVLERTAAFDPLMDHPGTFGVILGLMGPYLQIMGSQIYVRHPSEEALQAWHTDAGPSLRQIRVDATSLPLQFKVQFFLTDIPGPDRANFCLVPGSHRREFPEGGFPKGEDPPGAIQLCAEAGDAVIFPYAMWHSVARNQSQNVRRSVIFRYGQMWCRPYDYEKAPAHVLARMTPRRRRLMGDLGEGYASTQYYYSPKDQAEVMTEGF